MVSSALTGIVFVSAARSARASNSRYGTPSGESSADCLALRRPFSRPPPASAALRRESIRKNSAVRLNDIERASSNGRARFGDCRRSVGARRPWRASRRGPGLELRASARSQRCRGKALGCCRWSRRCRSELARQGRKPGEPRQDLRVAVAPGFDRAAIRLDRTGVRLRMPFGEAGVTFATPAAISAGSLPIPSRPSDALPLRRPSGPAPPTTTISKSQRRGDQPRPGRSGMSSSSS